MFDTSTSQTVTLAHSAGRDSRVTVWDLSNGTELYTFTGASDIVSALAFSNDASMLVVASDGRIARVFTLDPDRLLEIARSRTIRTLTDAVCQRYSGPIVVTERASRPAPHYGWRSRARRRNSSG